MLRTGGAAIIVILGRGFAGLSSAFELLRRGHKVAVVGPSPFDPTDGALTQASRAAVGVSSLKGHFLPQTDFFAAKIRGHQGLKSWVDLVETISKRSIPRFKGLAFEALYSEAEFSHLYQRIYHDNFVGFYKNTLISSTQLKQKAPNICFNHQEPLGAFQYDDDYWFDPTVCLEALEQAILNLGGSIYSGKLARFATYTDRKPPIFGVTIQLEGSLLENHHEISANNLVIACGSYTNDVLNMLGHPHLDLLLCTGVTIQLNKERLLNSKNSDSNCWYLRRRKLNIVNLLDRIIIGSSAFNHRVNRHGNLPEALKSEEFAASVTAFSANLPHIEGTLTPLNQGSYHWGARIRTKDRAPFIGNFSDTITELTRSQLSFSADANILQRIWIFSGLYKNGLQLAWLLAKQLAYGLEKGDSSTVSKAFSLKRLA